MKREAEPLVRAYECPNCRRVSYFHDRLDDLPETHPDFELNCVERFGGLVDKPCKVHFWKPNKKGEK